MKRFFTYLLATLAGIFISFFMLFLFLLIIVAASTGERPTEVRSNTVLYMKLNEQIVERAVENPLNYLPGNFSMVSEMGLNDILADIRKAKADDNISGIYMELTAIPAGLSTIEEIRIALLDFRESGKFVVSYSEFYTQKAYYLASASDKVYLNPSGDLMFNGLAAKTIFFKGAMEKLGIDVEVVRHGDFKSAVEPFTSKQMSKESRSQAMLWVGSIWDHMLEEISESRNVDVKELNELADNLSVRSGSHALEYGLVDGLMYKDEVINDLKERTGTDEKKDLSSISLRKYTKAVVKKAGKGYSRDKVAVIYAYGDVVMGSAGEGSIASERISRAIRKARRDSTIKAIVLRINSGGGSALASDVIWREADLARKVKPLVASYGDVAASGAYYLSAPADTILAQPATITGSIGVFALLPNFGTFLDKKIGITFDAAKTNPSADFGSPTRKLTGNEREVIEYGVSKVYDDFVSRVSEGRHMSREEVDAIGQGKVWSGVNAMQNGLIDLYGGLYDAIDVAAGMAGLEKYRTVSLPRLEDPIDEFIRKLAENARTGMIKKELGEEFETLKEMNDLKNFSGIQARLPYRIDLR